ncbi:TRAP transporter substrate-binding protein DctP [Psychrobacter sp.]|uniref:TRAP transporter substrate-binding protein n=1 Tax=Psychrobacter sp. TaxID=56811 RepID=UPI0025FDB25F|nr:TRAP transporter substrate-binding protein DctP [Psychrobacter sp.]
MYYGGGLELMQKVYKPHNIIPFPGGNTGMQMGGWFKKEINTVDDFKGLKMRIPGFAGEVIAETGAVPTTIPGGELYTALDRGTIDALEWVGPSMDITMGFHKIAPYYYTGWHEPGAELHYFVNDKAYDKLPADLQQILKTAMRVSADDMSVRTQYMSAEFLDKMKSEAPNVQIKTMPPAVLDELKKINNRLVGEMVKDNPLMKEIIDSQNAYQKKARAWSKMSDYQYIQDNQ